MPAPSAKGDASRRRLPNSGRAPDGDALRSAGPSFGRPFVPAPRLRRVPAGRARRARSGPAGFAPFSRVPRAGCRDRQTRESRPVNRLCPSPALFDIAIRVPKLPENEQNLASRLLTSFPRGINEVAFSSRGGRPRWVVLRKSDASAPCRSRKRVTNCKNKSSAPMPWGNMATALAVARTPSPSN